MVNPRTKLGRAARPALPALKRSSGALGSGGAGSGNLGSRDVAAALGWPLVAPAQGTGARFSGTAEGGERSQSWFPLVVLPRGADRDLVPRLRACRERGLSRFGSILFRGFGVGEDAAFHGVVTAVVEASAVVRFDIPAARLELPAWCDARARRAPDAVLQNVETHSREPPDKIWIWCMSAPSFAGAVALADCRDVYWRVPAAVRRRWSERGLMYVRVFEATGPNSWAAVLGTHDRAEVEASCERRGFGYEWGAAGALRIWRRSAPTLVRPGGEPVWFNQAHVFFAPPSAAGQPPVPRQNGWCVYHADGSAIASRDIQEVRSAFELSKLTLPWQAGDVLVLDNALTAHALLTHVPGALAMAHEYARGAPAPLPG